MKSYKDHSLSRAALIMEIVDQGTAASLGIERLYEETSVNKRLMSLGIERLYEETSVNRRLITQTNKKERFEIWGGNPPNPPSSPPSR